MKDESDPSTLSWEIQIPLATNGLMLLDWTKVLLLSFLLMFSLLAVAFGTQGEWAALLSMLPIFGGILGGIFILGLLIMLLLFGNRFHLRFTLTEEGALMETLDRRARIANRLGGSKGLLARSQETQAIPWSSVNGIAQRSRSRTISLRNRWRKVMVIYCTADNFEAVQQFLSSRTFQISDAGRHGRNPLWNRLVLTLLVLASCLPLFGLPYPFEQDLLLPFFLLCFAQATLWLARLLGWAVIVACLVQLGALLVRGFTSYRYELFNTEGSYTGFNSLMDGEILQIGLAFLGLGILLAIAVRAVKGKLPSMLEADQLGQN
jgi:hypothetical protein